MTKRVLFVAYAFPPVGGAGVQRVTKFVKYLPDEGWAPSVLTVSNPSVPAFDESLLEELPPETVITRAATLEPSYRAKAGLNGTGGTSQPSLLKRFGLATVKTILQPDPQILWAPQALRAGTKLLRRLPHDAIIATGPPYSSFLVGARLARRMRLPLVVDYRDEWGTDTAHREARTAARWEARLHAWMERRVLRTARLAITTTPASAEAIRETARSMGRSLRVECVYNGYDPSDFSAVRGDVAGEGRLTVCYTGTLWNLTSVRPLVDAALALHARAPGKAGRLRLLFAGRRTPEQEAMLDELDGTAVAVERRPYVTHAESIQFVADSSVACLIQANNPAAARMVNAKVFEYMALRRPILALVLPGEVRRVLAGYPFATCIEPGDVGGIANALEGMLDEFAAGRFRAEVDYDSAEYSRPRLTRQLVELLEETVVDRRPPHRSGGHR